VAFPCPLAALISMIQAVKVKEGRGHVQMGDCGGGGGGGGGGCLDPVVKGQCRVCCYYAAPLLRPAEFWRGTFSSMQNTIPQVCRSLQGPLEVWKL
jgi:hypothetical protein